ncbi:hypothetical protein MUP79_10285, partial [Candidatus Bathyarchaeota archaeon]|nr:hypothetical protein [Candidatus Bathyarchaeota archaeon]
FFFFLCPPFPQTLYIPYATPHESCDVARDELKRVGVENMTKAKLEEHLHEFLGRHCDIVYWDRELKSEVTLDLVHVIAVDDEFLLVKNCRRLNHGENFVMKVEIDVTPSGDEVALPQGSNQNLMVWSIERIFLNALRSIKHSTYADKE